MRDRFGHHVSYLRVSVTDRCNERCRYCMPDELQEWLPREGVLTFPEMLRLIRVAASLGVDKLRVTGGEPLTRAGIVDFLREVARIDGLKHLGLSTNGTLLSRKMLARELRDAGVISLNISLDTLDRAAYHEITGRDFLPRVLEGIDAAVDAQFSSIKLNAVLMRGRSEDQLLALVDFAAKKNVLLRFIELMPVSTTEMLDDSNFFPINQARRAIEARFGALIPQPDFRTNGPATYYQIPGRDQRIGFIGALTNLHFCESCNKLRLTCDGKLRPCLGSHLEFDILRPLRAGASDEELKNFFLRVVERKPERHEFRENYQPQRRMVAIGG
jgi:cyclic pyranopterin phosphate synthase